MMCLKELETAKTCDERGRTHQDTSTTGRNDINERGPTAQIMCNHITYPRCQHHVLPLPYLKLLLKVNLPSKPANMCLDLKCRCRGALLLS